MKRLYLDANGQNPSLPAAQQAITELLGRVGNPSSFHEEGRAVRMVIDEARAVVASVLSSQPKDIIFTSGASEANRLFVDALIKKARILNQCLKVLMSPFEHPSLYKPLAEAHEHGFISLSIIDVSPQGELIIDDVMIKNCDVLIICQAHNETGLIPNLDKALSLVRPEALVMSDISQGLSRLNPVSTRVDAMSCSAQKMGAFAGSGALIMRGNAKTLPAPWLGGGQERGFRPGTENVLLIAAFAQAARHLDEQRAQHSRQTLWRDKFEEKLASSFPVKIIGQGLPRLPNTSAICFYQEDPDALRIACDLHGLSVGFGAACSGLAPEGSFALKRLGLTLNEEKLCVRFSFAPSITAADLDEAFLRLAMFLKRVL